jgi:soluble lytic murein transglycosylase
MRYSSLLWRSLIHGCLGLVCACGVSAPAAAQIYSWHDASGRLVLSDRPSGAVERTYSVPETSAIRTTRQAQPADAGQYDDLITEHARLNAVRTDLVRAVVQVESRFNAYAVSPKGAMGLMQLMPATARRFGVSNPFNAAENVRAGVAYLRELLDRYQNREPLALAAYNAGPAAVDRHAQSVPPYVETRQYVERVSGLAGRVSPPAQRGDTIYRSIDFVNGREIPKYSNKASEAPPRTGEHTEPTAASPR